MAEKLALIDKDLLMRLISKNTPVLPPANPVLKEMSRIDDELESTLQNSKTPDRVKSRKLNQLLLKHDNFHKQYDQPGARPTGQPPLPPPSVPDPWEIKTVNAAPLKNKKITESLMTHLKLSNKINWDSQGRLIIDGVTYPSTNILDLVHGVTRKRVKAKVPEGTSEFIRALGSINTPQELAPNMEFLKNAKPQEAPRKLLKKNKPTRSSSGRLTRDALPSPYLRKLRSSNLEKKSTSKKKSPLRKSRDEFSTPPDSPMHWESLF